MIIKAIGLNTDAVQNVIKLCENTLDKAGCDCMEIDTMYENAKEILNKHADFDNLSDSIINAFYRSTINVLKEKELNFCVEYIDGQISKIYNISYIR